MHRVVLANDSRLLRGMLKHVIDKAPGLEVVDEISDRAMLLAAVERTRPHWAIVSLSRDGSMPETVDRILGRCSSVGILGIATDGTLTKVKRVACDEQILGCVSLEELISVLLEKDARPETEPGPGPRVRGRPACEGTRGDVVDGKGKEGGHSCVR
jgi:DNA-binding NarL/FixJ family response regulator